MYRQGRQMLQEAEILEIVKKCKVCHLGLARDNVPYVIPVYYGYDIWDEQLILYFDCPPLGKKMDILRQNQNACFEINTLEQAACNAACECIGGTGRIAVCRDGREKEKALKCIAGHYRPGAEPVFSAEEIERASILKLFVIDYTGKWFEGV